MCKNTLVSCAQLPVSTQPRLAMCFEHTALAGCSQNCTYFFTQLFCFFKKVVVGFPRFPHGCLQLLFYIYNYITERERLEK